MDMNFPNQIAFRLGLKKIEPQIIHKWIWQQNNTMLVFALKTGSIKIRTQVVNELRITNLRDPAIIRQLIHIIQRDFLELAQKASDLLRPLLPQLNGKVRRSAQDALNKLKDRLRREQNRKIVYRKHQIKNTAKKLFDKGKMKQLERVRQQLKKAIRLW